MKFKSDHMKGQLEECHPFLRYLCNEFDHLSLSFGIEPVVTRVFDKIEGESGVHADKRAVDFRDEFSKNEFIYPEQVRNEILKKINDSYRRTDGFKTLIWHSFNGAPLHFHLQVAPSEYSYYDKKVYFLKPIEKPTNTGDVKLNSWDDWGNHILTELKRLNENLENISNKYNEDSKSIWIEISTLKVKAGIWGVLGGIFASIPVVVAYFFKN